MIKTLFFVCLVKIFSLHSQYSQYSQYSFTLFTIFTIFGLHLLLTYLDRATSVEILQLCVCIPEVTETVTSQTLPSLRRISLYCTTAWNENHLNLNLDISEPIQNQITSIFLLSKLYLYFYLKFGCENICFLHKESTYILALHL